MVYSPHTYGPSVFAQPFFSDAAFPGNMPAIWRFQYGAMADEGVPIVIGEWGGKLNGKDHEWQLAFAKFLSTSSIVGSFVCSLPGRPSQASTELTRALACANLQYWCLNPESSDTGGLLVRRVDTPAQRLPNAISDKR